MSKKILIIDDSEQDRKIIRRFITKAGYDNIVLAVNGEEGVEKAKQEKPDLVITDTMMPGINGFDTCRKIRDFLNVEQTKIIVITGQIDAVDAIAARNAGADDYCAKTSDYMPLIESVKNLIG